MKTRMEYWVLLVTKNGQNLITKTLDSILKQTVPAKLICIVDDGSKDETPFILKRFLNKFPKRIHIVTLPDKGFEVRRLPHNFNLAIKEVERLGVETRYTMISGDDCIYPSDYNEFLIDKMENNPKMVVTSGDINNIIPDATPRGSGRIIRNSFFKKIGNKYPPYYGYEGWILHKALQLGYEIQNFTELRYEHLRPLGKEHKFTDWGLAMKCLGYHPLEVLYRCVKYVLIDRRLPITYFRIALDYFIRPFGLRNDPYFHPFDEDLRKYIWKKQIQKLIL
ncbi:MAG: glycosyltransferase family A protein [Candidatus Bathyarchaeia archaeon]